MAWKMRPWIGSAKCSGTRHSETRSKALLLASSAPSSACSACRLDGGRRCERPSSGEESVFIAHSLVHLAESGDSVRGWGESKMQHTAEIGSPPAVAGESGVDSLCESPPCLEREGEPCRQRRPHRFNFRLTMNAN